jgi:ABC-type transport system substrate-binding protein
METNFNGSYIYNMNVLAAEPTVVENADGSKTYTMTIKEGLKFSDGSAITAKNYIAGTLVNSTAVGVAAGGSGNAGQVLAGYDAFKAYEGGEVAKGASKFFSGVMLIDEYTFAVTIIADYAQYYYGYTYAAFSPDPLALYLGDNDIVVDPATKACGLSDSFYAKVEQNGAQVYAMADVINANLKWNSGLPYSGPYVVSDYNESTRVATLTLNPVYTGDERGKATIATITYIKVETETQMDKFTQGEVDVIAGITGGTETEAALAVVEANPEKYTYTSYARAGYGKMGFRGDLGSTAFTEVRQAIMYTLNRPEFAQAFTGGYGSVVHGAYYEGFDAYIANKAELEEKLNTYAFSVDDAIAVLEEGGWIYNVKGETFDASKDDIRYKKLSGYELSADNIQFKSTDSKYKTVKINGEYYMPLVVNWYGTQPNEVTDLLITSWQETKAATKDIGMYISYTSCDFMSGVYGELYQYEDYGFDGVAKLNCINFATGFNSALYDYSWNWTIDPDVYDIYSAYYIMDAADFYADYQ